jgi:hypothetical protein
MTITTAFDTGSTAGAPESLRRCHREAAGLHLAWQKYRIMHIMLNRSAALAVSRPFVATGTWFNRGPRMIDRFLIAAIVDRLIYEDEATFSAEDARQLLAALPTKRSPWIQLGIAGKMSGGESAPAAAARHLAGDAKLDPWRGLARQLAQQHACILGTECGVVAVDQAIDRGCDQEAVWHLGLRRLYAAGLPRTRGSPQGRSAN